jgi:2-desacetyl-2-hydroxyethyl bacteriochlorophyllide A dehydrogenase
MSKMRQAIMTSPGNIKFHDVPSPFPGMGEVLIRIRRIGICGSDVHVWHGKHPYTSYPVVQGHEFSGVVENIGKNVRGIRVGIKVTATPQVVCGECNPCMRGDYHICDTLKVQGFQVPGVAQDFFVTKAKKIVPLPDSFSFEQGALVEPISVAVHSVAKVNNIGDKNVVVFGAGPIGNLVGQVAQAKGANVLITDISDYRLEISRKCRLKNIFNSKNKNLKDEVNKFFGEKGFDVAFECVGIEATMTDAIENIQKGGTIVVVGVFAVKPRINLGIVQDRELMLMGTLMYKYEDYVHSVEIIDSGKVLTEPLLSKHFPFNQYADAYRYIDQNCDNTMKVFIYL